MYVRLGLGVTAVAALLTCSPRALAQESQQAKDSTGGEMVLLPATGSAASPAIEKELELALHRAGKQVQRSALQLEELMLAVECNTPSVKCLQKIGANIQMKALILAKLDKGGEGIELSLRWFDVESGGDRGRAMVVLPVAKSPDRDKLMLKAVRDLFGIKAAAAAPPQAATGGLAITSSVKLAEITIDGQPRGATPLELRNLKAGSYRVEASREGYATWRGTAEVKADQMTRIVIEMAPSAATAPAPSFLDSIRVRTWVVAGVGAACLATGIALGAHLNALQNEMDGLSGDTFAEIDRMEQLKESGEREAVAANVLLGIGGGALLTSLVLAYLDYARGGRPAGEEAPAAAQARQPGATLLIGTASLGLQITY